jgi:hypothetical protein
MTSLAPQSLLERALLRLIWMRPLFIVEFRRHAVNEDRLSTAGSFRMMSAGPLALGHRGKRSSAGPRDTQITLVSAGRILERR